MYLTVEENGRLMRLVTLRTIRTLSHHMYLHQGVGDKR